MIKNSIPLKNYALTFWQIFLTDLNLFKQDFLSKLINICVWMGLIVAVTAYVFPAMGMIPMFGEFIAFSQIAGEGFWKIWPNSFSLIADIEGSKTINNLLRLPIPSWLVFIEKALFHTFKSLTFTIFTLPLAKIIIWHKMSFTYFSIAKFLLIIIIANIFYGFLYLFLASFTKNKNSVEMIGIRVLFPLWFMGSTSFPWKVLQNSVSKNAAYINLLNPLTYCMEGIHSAALNSNDYLNYWICVGMIIIFTLIAGIIGIKRFQKRLDVV